MYSIANGKINVWTYEEALSVGLIKEEERDINDSTDFDSDFSIDDDLEIEKIIL